MASFHHLSSERGHQLQLQPIPHTELSILSNPVDVTDSKDASKQVRSLYSGLEVRLATPAVLAKQNTSARRNCVWNLVWSSSLCLSCIVTAVILLSRFEGPGTTANLVHPTQLTNRGAEAISFLINIAVAQATDGLAYIHSVSLRWALLKEQRLEFNTNIRLFAASRCHGPNKWYANLLSAACLVLCYAATSQLIIIGDNLGDRQLSTIYVNSVALLVLGIGLLGNIVLSVWCLLITMRHVHMWSANPLAVTLTALYNGLLQHHPGRSMLPVTSRTQPATPSTPSVRQPSTRQAMPSLRWLVLFIWLLAVLALGWSLAVMLVLRRTVTADFDKCIAAWSFSMSWSGDGGDYCESATDLALYMNPPWNNNHQSSTNLPLGVQFVLGTLFVCAVQGLQTLGLHSVELVVNAHRDEDAWKQIASRLQQRTHSLAAPPFVAALLSWENAVLFAMKATLHWLLGQALVPYYSVADGTHSSNITPGVYSFRMRYARLLVYTILIIAFAAFVTFLVYHRPRSMQPAAWGHLQTLTDLVDDWALDEDGRLWWGDKGVVDPVEGIRHAGTGPNKETLSLIARDALYM
jgi:hypothetical protein